MSATLSSFMQTYLNAWINKWIVKLSDQTAQMCILIWSKTVRIRHVTKVAYGGIRAKMNQPWIVLMENTIANMTFRCICTGTYFGQFLKLAFVYLFEE